MEESIQMFKRLEQLLNAWWILCTEGPAMVAEAKKTNGEAKEVVQDLTIEQRLELIMAAQTEASGERQAIMEGIGEILEKLNDLVIYDNDGMQVSRFD